MSDDKERDREQSEMERKVRKTERREGGREKERKVRETERKADNGEREADGEKGMERAGDRVEKKRNDRKRDLVRLLTLIDI